MKKQVVLFPAIVIFLIMAVLPAIADELNLYDFWGNPVAYISAESDSAIYVWDGTPLAYLVKNGRYHNIYGFNGKHLGWFEDGVIWDHGGNKVGFIKGAPDIHVFPRAETERGPKQEKPDKDQIMPEPEKPAKKSDWSKITLTSMLYEGKK